MSFAAVEVVMAETPVAGTEGAQQAGRQAGVAVRVLMLSLD